MDLLLSAFSFMQLKLYSQFNSLENVAVLSDDDAYAVKAVPVKNIRKIYHKSLETFFSFVIVFPLDPDYDNVHCGMLQRGPSPIEA